MKLIQLWHQDLFCSSFLCFLGSGINSYSRWSHCALPHWFLIALISAISDYPLDWCISMSLMCVSTHRYIHDFRSAFTCLNHLRGKPLKFSFLQSLTSLFQFLPIIMQSSCYGLYTPVPNQYSPRQGIVFLSLFSDFYSKSACICLKYYPPHSTLICAVDIYQSYTLIHFLQTLKWPRALSVWQLFTSHGPFTYLLFGERKDWFPVRIVTRRQMVIQNI